jgi:hypothetical protein
LFIDKPPSMVFEYRLVKNTILPNCSDYLIEPSLYLSGLFLLLFLFSVSITTRNIVHVADQSKMESENRRIPSDLKMESSFYFFYGIVSGSLGIRIFRRESSIANVIMALLSYQCTLLVNKYLQNVRRSHKQHLILNTS